MRSLFYIIVFIFVSLGGLLFALNTPDLPKTELIDKYANEESRFLEVDNMNIHYRIEGQGPALVLLHGTASSLHTWDVWTEMLKDSLQVVRLDLPAFGLTGPHPIHDYSLDTYADVVIHFLDKIDVDRFSIAGNSLGGSISRKIAEKYPERIEQLILIDPGGYKTNKALPFAFRLGRTPVLKHLISSITPLSLFEKSIKEVYHDDSKISDKLLMRYYELSLAPGNRDALVARMNQESEEKWKSKFLKMPVLIMWGKMDEWIPVTLVDSFLRDIPEAEVVIYEQAGHVPMEEIPYETAEDARQFLGRKN